MGLGIVIHIPYLPCLLANGHTVYKKYNPQW
jgi:hypothetical protein